MSHKTAYRTLTSPDLNELETQVNDYIKSIYKNEHHEEIKVNDITTFSMKENYIAAVTYSYAKKKSLSFEVPFETAKPEIS
jgi:hypothetical protein